MAETAVVSVNEKPAGYVFGRPTKYRQEMCQRIMELGSEGASLTEMRVDIGIHHKTWNDWINPESPIYKQDFSAAVKEAMAASQAWWERKGRLATFDSKDFSATSYIFQMKNRFKEDWSDRTINEQTGTVRIEWGKPE